ncbi:MAG: 2-phospho-L-lactate guanylyltransferase [Dehalococcoidia bacterium]
MTSVVIPVNRLDRVKGRLDPLLSAAERRDLMLATLRTVLEAVRSAGLEPEILTASPAELTDAGIDAIFIAEDGNGGGLNGQVGRAVGARMDVLILHADLPRANSVAIAQVLNAKTESPGVTIVRSGDGGTNAMLLRPAGGFALAYGTGSYAAHVAAAKVAGYDIATVVSPELALDLDTEADLRTFMRLPGWERSRAGEVLLRIGIPGRLGSATGADHRPKRRE